MIEPAIARREEYPFLGPGIPAGTSDRDNVERDPIDDAEAREAVPRQTNVIAVSLDSSVGSSRPATDELEFVLLIPPGGADRIIEPVSLWQPETPQRPIVAVEERGRSFGGFVKHAVEGLISHRGEVTQGKALRHVPAHSDGDRADANDQADQRGDE